MVHGSVKVLLRVVGAVSITILVAAAWLGIRLSQGPIDLDFLSSYVEDALTTPQITVHLSGTMLVLDEDTHALKIRTHNVRFSTSEGEIGRIPSMTVSLSVPALLSGRIAPRGIRLRHPTLRLVRDVDGRLHLGPAPAAGTAAPSAALPLAEPVLEALTATPEADSLIAHLRAVDLVGGEMVIEDRRLGRQWRLPTLDVSLRRHGDGLTIHLGASLEGAREALVLSADGKVATPGGAVHGTLGFSGLHPNELAGLAPELAPLTGADLPVAGQLTFAGSLADGLSEAQFTIESGAGRIAAPDLLGETWPVQSFSASGSVWGNGDAFAIDEATLNLGGPVAELKGHAEALLTAGRFSFDASLSQMPVDELKTFWPPSLAPNPRLWVTTHLSKGMVDKASVHVAGHRPEGAGWADAVIDTIGGEVHPTGVTVDYLPPMPPVRGVSATCRFNADTFEIAARSGQTLGLSVPEGTIVLSGLSAPEQFADIALTIKGPVGDALRVIDSKPLNYAQALGIAPSKVKGDASVALNLRIPLLEAARLDQIKLEAKAETSHVAIPDVAVGLDLGDAALTLDVDTKGMNLTGKGLLGGAEADIRWRENFAKGAPFRSRYMVDAILDDHARADLGLDGGPFQPPYLSGPVAVNLLATLGAGGKGDISVKADLGMARMALPGFNWVKGVGGPAEAKADLRLAAGHLAEISRFTVTARTGDLGIDGRAAFDGTRVRQVVFTKAKWSRSDLKGTLTFKSDGSVGADLSGVFDAREMIGGTPTDLPVGETTPTRHVHDHEPVTPLSVSAKFSRVWVGHDSTLSNVTVEMTRDHLDWRRARIDGTVSGGQPLHVELAPGGANQRTLKVTSDDAGAVFRALDIFDSVMGGSLEIDAAFDDADPRQPLKGMANVRDFRLVKAPALARLLTVAALTGAVDVLSGKGIHFSTLVAPFTLTDGVLEFADARAYGTELGLTAKGQVDLDHNRLALEGTIVPAYVINSAFSKIPVLGSLLAPEKGGGVIAMNYSLKGPTDDPSVSVNPLSALTPGFLRRFFDIFDDGTGTEVRPREETPAAAGAPKDGG